MWQTERNTGISNPNSLLKESLLRQLSQTIQEIQLSNSKKGEVCSTQQGTTDLIVVLESIFLHAMKRSALASVLKSMSVADDTKPSPSFYDAVLSVTHKSVVARIAKLNRLTCDAGRSRAWIRLALNENAMSSYLIALSSDRRISRFYTPAAFLRDREALDMAAHLVEGLLTIPFDIPLNSSLLNIWSTDPLLMSGLWSPAIKASVQMAVDVAGGIEDEDMCSIGTGSVRSLLTLDESHAIQIILNTPIFGQKPDLPEKIIEEVDKKMDELEKERNDILQRSYSVLVASCSPQSEDMFPDSMKNTQNEVLEAPENKIEDVPKIESIISDTKVELEKDYSELLNDYSADFSEPLKIISKEINDFKEETPVNDTIEALIMHIPREIGLRDQCYQCADCQLSIGLNYGPPLLCNVTGYYLCENCHKFDMGIIPSRIIFNWDYNKYPTGIKATSYIDSILTKPIFDLNILNKKLYGAVPEINEILILRKQLNLLHLYLSTCKEPIEVSIREYIYENPHLYALSDLVLIPNGGLKAEIIKYINQWKNHVINCRFCKEKGFICELCKDSKVIYPFDEGLIYRCNKCKAVYHGNCILEKKNCPKCRRKSTRTNEES